MSGTKLRLGPITDITSTQAAFVDLRAYLDQSFLGLLNSGSAAPTLGTAVLVAGTVTIPTAQALTSSRVLLTRKVAGGTIGDLTYTIVNMTSLKITSSNALDTSTVDWLIVNA